MVNQVLERLPPGALKMGGVAVGVLIVLSIGLVIYRAGRDDAFVREGNSLFESGDHAKAVVAFEKALEWDNTNLKAISGGLEASYKAGQTAKIKRFEGDVNRLLNNKDLRVDKEQAAEILGRAADIYLEMRKISEAGVANRNAMKLTTPSPRMKEVEAHVVFAQDLYDDARKLYEAIVQKGSEDPLVYLNLARLEIRDGNEEKASSYISKAKQASPAEANVELARIHEKQNKAEEALACWKAAVEAKGDLAPARYGYGRALLLADKLAESALNADEAVRLDEESVPYRELLVEVLYKKGEFSKAVEHADIVIQKTSPKSSPSAQFFKGATLLRRGSSNNDLKDLRDGEALISAAVKERNSAADLLAVAELLSNIDKRERAALDYVEKALKLEPASPAAHKLKCQIVGRGKDIGALGRALDEALKVLPADLTLNKQRADMFWRNTREDQRPQAIEIYERLLKEHRDDEALHIEYVEKLLDYADKGKGLGDSQKAELFDKAIEVLDKELKGRMSSSNPEVEKKLKYAKLARLQFG